MVLSTTVLGPAPSLRAHDPGLSAVSLRFTNNHLAVQLTLAKADVETIVWLDENLDGRVSPQEFAAAKGKLEPLAFSALELAVDDVVVGTTNMAMELDASDAIHFRFEMPRPRGTQLRVKSEILAELPRGHRQYISLKEGQQLLGEQLLDADDNVFAATLAEQRGRSFGEFLSLGVEHIAMGYDHLAFLCGLLIVGGTFRSALKVITAFTIAHSITLALVTLDLVRISPKLVEPLIAVSIIYVGLENILRRKLEKRWLLAFSFGLIHGCGFATVLRDMGIGSDAGGVLVPLLSFNLGVELGQLAITAFVLPLIWKLNNLPSFQPRYMPACSALIALAGAYWLVERVWL
jgi:hydrogenase/urease accessory protein HupE